MLSKINSLIMAFIITSTLASGTTPQDENPFTPLNRASYHLVDEGDVEHFNRLQNGIQTRKEQCDKLYKYPIASCFLNTLSYSAQYYFSILAPGEKANLLTFMFFSFCSVTATCIFKTVEKMREAEQLRKTADRYKP